MVNGSGNKWLSRLGKKGGVALLSLCFLWMAGCDSGLTSSDGRIYPGGRLVGWSLALSGDEALVAALETDQSFVLENGRSEWAVAAELRP